MKESDGAGGVVDVTRKFPVWLRPVAGYGTPMCEALSLASEGAPRLDSRSSQLLPSLW